MARTHYPGCWRHRGHHACAIASVERAGEEYRSWIEERDARIAALVHDLGTARHRIAALEAERDALREVAEAAKNWSCMECGVPMMEAPEDYDLEPGCTMCDELRAALSRLDRGGKR